MSLSAQQLATLKVWLSSHSISTTKIHRDFSNGTAFAELLKQYHPKLVDLNNYRPYSNTKMKLSNWETLNVKVLQKLGLRQRQSFLEKLAGSEEGAIECLLHEIMEYETEEWRRKNHIVGVSDNIWHVSDDVFVVPVTKAYDDEIVTEPQKMVLFSKYENAVLEEHRQTALLREANQKIVHLENLLCLKTECLTDIYNELANMLYEYELARNQGCSVNVDVSVLHKLYNTLQNC